MSIKEHYHRFFHKNSGDRITSSLLTYARAINELQDLSPCPSTNFLFTGLVKLVRDFPPKSVITQILQNNELQKLRPKLIEQCGKGEYLLEASFAKQVISGEKEVEQFTYYENYQRLIAFEISALAAYSSEDPVIVLKIAVIGSGPLPLTSIVLAQHLKNTTFVNYDHSNEALQLGQGVVNATDEDLAKRMEFVPKTALEITEEELSDVDLVYLAALVDDKERVLDHLGKSMRRGSILMARSAIGLRTLLYNPIPEYNSTVGFSKFVHYHPTHKHIINSVAIATKI